MKRREFLQGLIAGAAFGPALGSAAQTANRSDAPARRRMLSTEGCGRATGYAEANKIITHEGKTHVAWLDSPPEGFRVRIRTLDRRTGRWSPRWTVGEAFDNHGGPALTMDSAGYLHIVYYPHHHPMRYRRSLRPNDASAWSEEVEFAQRATYPTLMCGPDDTLYLTCRESRRDGPWQVNLYVKPPGGSWQGPKPVLQALFPGYAHFQEALAWDRDHAILHLSCRIYERDGERQTVGYLRSRDYGQSWERADGAPVPLPATSRSVDVIAAAERKEPKPALRCGSIAVDSGGRPHVLFSDSETLPARSFIASPDGGQWARRPLAPIISQHWPGWGAQMPGGLVFAGARQIYAALTRVRREPDDPETLWGHPGSEIVWLESRDGGRTFTAVDVTEPDPATPRWLPNLERPTGFNALPADSAPGLIYTSGVRGQTNRELLRNEIFWAQRG